MTIKSRSGTETVHAESNWHYSLGEAERECLREIDDAVRIAVSELESSGKRIIGNAHYPISSEERQVGEETPSLRGRPDWHRKDDDVRIDDSR
mgnify:CR=1 FL=1